MYTYSAKYHFFYEIKHFLTYIDLVEAIFCDFYLQISFWIQLCPLFLEVATTVVYWQLPQLWSVKEYQMETFAWISNGFNKSFIL